MCRWLSLTVLLTVATLAFAGIGDQDIDVTVVPAGDGLDVQVSLRVRTRPEDTWSVLTDYASMPRFVTNLDTSVVVERSANTMRVEQAGSVHLGLLSFPFSTVRRIELDPYREIRSTIVGGNMKSSHFTTRLLHEGADTLILQRGHVVSDLWIPPWIGPAVVAAETRRQWQEFRREILRRASQALP